MALTFLISLRNKIMIIEGKSEVFFEQIELGHKLTDEMLWISVGNRKNKSFIKIDKERAIKIVLHLKDQFDL